ncbi:hypothetical protein B0H14DRAFT_2629405 [Mycena olivaceomarginata]|nr:hypothetical protein B0H14DRAFT_2629405 [Mycena olivaceomarginata]
MYWKDLGHYKQTLSLCIKAQDLLNLCTVSSSDATLAILNTSAEIHRAKSEYNRDAYWHTGIFFNIAQIEVSMGVPKAVIQRNIAVAQSIFTSVGLKSWITNCDTILAALHLRERDLLAAGSMFEKCLKLNLHSETLQFLGDVFLAQQDEDTGLILLSSQWPCSTKEIGSPKEKYAIASKILPQDGLSVTGFLNFTVPLPATTIENPDVSMFFIIQSGIQRFLFLMATNTFTSVTCDYFYQVFSSYSTAISLFTVALEGFTLMDVHYSRAECMIRLGDNFKRHGDILQAIELWNVARPLFERSSQVEEVKYIDERLACVGSDVLEQHRENQACLTDLHVGEANLSVAKIGDSEEVHLSNE